jgi:hypothetical protein
MFPPDLAHTRSKTLALCNDVADLTKGRPESTRRGVLGDVDIRGSERARTRGPSALVLTGLQARLSTEDRSLCNMTPVSRRTTPAGLSSTSCGRHVNPMSRNCGGLPSSLKGHPDLSMCISR